MNNPDPPQNQQPPPGAANDARAEKDRREMYAEIAALIGALAKTFAMEESAAAAAVESGAMALEFGRDANGNRFVAANFGGKTARIYQGAIKHG
jgi:hypothetical protein